MSLSAPKCVETQCSAIQTGQEYVLTASGGVSIASWHIADKTELLPAVAKIRQTAKPSGSGNQQVWWNPAR
jgi:hypothetical protein